MQGVVLGFIRVAVVPHPRPVAPYSAADVVRVGYGAFHIGELAVQLGGDELLARVVPLDGFFGGDLSDGDGCGGGSLGEVGAEERGVCGAERREGGGGQGRGLRKRWGWREVGVGCVKGDVGRAEGRPAVGSVEGLNLVVNMVLLEVEQIVGTVE